MTGLAAAGTGGPNSDVPRVALLGGSGWLGHGIATLLAGRPDASVIGRDALGDVDTLRRALRPDAGLVVVNAAGLLRGTDAELQEANVALVERLVSALDGSGAHLVHLGSPAEYGDPGGPVPIPESRILAPVSTYGRTKAAATALVLDYPGACVLRPFNVLDADMTPLNPIRIVRDGVQEAVAAGTPVRLDAALAVRDHVSRGFVARSVVRAADERIAGVYNLCSGVGLAYGEIAEAIAHALGATVALDDLDRPGIRVVVGDPGAWRARTGLAEAMDAPALARLVLA